MKLLAHHVAVSASMAFMVGGARAQTLLFERYGDAASDQFGSAVASVGDVDADGAPDWAVGAPYNDSAGSNAGQVRIYSGRTLLVLFEWHGGNVNAYLGAAVAEAGDINGDGNADVLVGAPGIGRAFAYSGATGLPLLTLIGSSSASYGAALAGGGQIDGDGIPDILVGAPYKVDGTGSHAGQVYVHSGATGTLIRSHAGQAGENDVLGWSVAFYGDADGDGRDEYVGGAPGEWVFGTPEVRAFDGASGTLLWIDSAANINDQLGFSLARLSDVTGDGIDDVLVGAPQDPGVGCGCLGQGFVRLLDGASGAIRYQVNGALGYRGLGWAVAAIGDSNGNGYEDFAASQPGTEGCGGTSASSVQICDGRNGALIASIAPPAGSQQFGTSLASGDANGDGLRDLIGGAPCSNTSGAYAGSVYAYTLVRSVVSYCESETNSHGCTPAIAGVGTPSATLAQVFDVRATSVLNNKSGLLFYGFKPRQTPFQGGHMCVVAPTIRTPVQNSGGSLPPANDCTGVFTLDFNARIQSGVDPLLIVGEEVFAQFWSRDPPDASTTNLTNALAFFINP